MNLQEKIRKLLREETKNVSRDYSDQDYEEEYSKQIQIR
jgi:hypothetical protein